MAEKISRRDFLKIAGLFPLSIAAPRVLNSFDVHKKQNVIIIVFDAFSAHNISLYGYQRETTPNLSRLAERAVVYHNHYAGGNFTTPGTASLLTGTFPWTHRALQHKGKTEKIFSEHNFFTAFENYYRLAYSHNRLVNVLEEQFKDSIDNLIPRERLLLNKGFYIPTFLKNDEDIFTVSLVRSYDRRVDGITYSLFFSYINEQINNLNEEKFATLRKQYPRGIPGLDYESHYLLENGIDMFGELFMELPQPFMSYLHFMPPHFPYNTHREFYGRFEFDGYVPEKKPLDQFYRDDDFERIITKRKAYDEFILYVDREFGRLIDYLNQSGILENTWVILTSDHGEMFERGIYAHTTPVLYEPVIRIPLMIFEPGRKSRLDVHTPTSAVDVLPTMLHVTGQSQANWVEGKILPPYSASSIEDRRNLFIIDAKKTYPNAPLTTATLAMKKENYKIMYFFGYTELDGEERIELYDIENDPEELKDLYTVKRETASEMLHELKSNLAESEKPYL